MSAKWKNAASLILAALNVETNLPTLLETPHLSKIGVKQSSNMPHLPASSFDFRVLTVQRELGASFMAGAHVFPGGVVDESLDSDHFWIEKETTDTIRGSPLSGYTHFSSHHPFPEVIFRVCALRELFEECGLVPLYDSEYGHSFLFSTAVDKIETTDHSEILSELKTIRPLVRQSPHLLLALLTKHKRRYRLAHWHLLEFSNWLTPTMEMTSNKVPKRFDTIFYLLCSNGMIPADVCKDELAGGEWSDPLRLLSQAQEGEMFLPPPQIYELSRMARFSNISDLYGSARQMQNDRVVERLCPQFILSSDGVRIELFPGDDLYVEENFEFISPKIVDKTAQELREEAQVLRRYEFPSSNFGKTKQFSEFSFHIKNTSGPLLPVTVGQTVSKL